MKIVLTDAKMKIMQSVWADLNALGNIVVTENDDEDTLIQAVADADLVVICYAPITRKIIDAGKKLKAILKWGVGVDSIDMPAANEHGLPVCHCPMYGSGTIADHAFALLMALARKLVPLVNATQHNGWIWPDPSRQWAGMDLEEKVIGIIGMGRIGRKMAQRCNGFDMKVIAYDPLQRAVPPELGFVEKVDLEDLLQRSDFISLHAVLNQETRNLISARGDQSDEAVSLCHQYCPGRFGARAFPGEGLEGETHCRCCHRCLCIRTPGLDPSLF